MVVLLLGAPGSGKGTIANYLKNHNFFHLSSGDLFRKIMHQNSQLAQEVKKNILAGKLVSDDLTNAMVKNELLSIKNNNLVLDGYPRNVNQAKFLVKLIKIDYVFDLVGQEQQNIKRILGRRICPICQSIYNIYFKKPKKENHCDYDDAILIKRDDDNEQTIKKRFNEYQKFNLPLVEFYQAKKIYQKINNDNLQYVINQIDKFLKIK